MDTRKFIVIGGVLGTVLLVLILVTSLLGGRTTQPDDQSISPTSFPRSFDPNRNTGLGEAPTSSEAAQKALVEEIKNRSSTLPAVEKGAFNKAKSAVPFKTENFEVDYSPSVDQFVIYARNDAGVQESEEWIVSHNLYDAQRANPALFPRVRQPVDEYTFLTDKFSEDPQNLPPQSQPESLPEVQSAGEIPGARILSDVFSAFLNLDFGSATVDTASQQGLITGNLSALGTIASDKAPYLASACGPNIAVYQQTEQITGVPWAVIAALHYREGSCGSDRSVVSGEIIGRRNPDRRPSECQGGGGGIGTPKPVAGGCGFASLLDSAVFAANHLKGKIGGVPSSVEDMAKAFGRYNGIGNRNCGKTPYSNCPPKFENDDHNYAMNQFDSAHESMYVVYCANGRRCNPPRRDQRPGAVAVVRLILGK